jgi:hypothetical protein
MDVFKVRMLKYHTLVADITPHGTNKRLCSSLYIANVIRMINAMKNRESSDNHINVIIKNKIKT